MNETERAYNLVLSNGGRARVLLKEGRDVRDLITALRRGQWTRTVSGRYVNPAHVVSVARAKS